MNTKTTKFLAVLAVMVMAFAAIVVVAPASDSDAATTTYDVQSKTVNNINSTTITTAGEYYFNDDGLTVTFKTATFDAATIIYVLDGISIDITADNANAYVPGVISLISVQKEENASTSSAKVYFRNYGDSGYTADSVAELTAGATFTVKSQFSTTKDNACFIYSDADSMNIKENSILTGRISNVYMRQGEVVPTSAAGDANPIITAQKLTAKVYGSAVDNDVNTSVLTVQSFSGTLRVSDEGYLQILTITAGTVTGNATSAMTYIIGSDDKDGNASISSGAKLVLTGTNEYLTITMEDYLNNAGTIQTIKLPAPNGDLFIYNEGTIVLKKDTSANAVIPSLENVMPIKSAETGTVDISEFAETADFRGTVQEELTITKAQIMHFYDDVKIPAGAVVYVFGQLIIDDDVSVTVEDGGRLIIGQITTGSGTTTYPIASVENNGTIEVASSKTATYNAVSVLGGNIINFGTITTPGDYDKDDADGKESPITVASGANITNAGDFTINAGDYVTLNMINASLGSFNIYGTISAVSAVINEGAIDIDQTVLAADLNIYNVDKTAKTSIISAETVNSDLNIYGSKTVFDALLGTTVGGIKIEVTTTPGATNNGIVYGIDVTGCAQKVATYGTLSKYAKTVYGIAISGAPSMSSDATLVSLTFSGNVFVNETFDVDNKTQLTFSAATMYIYGAMTSETTNFGATTGTTSIWVFGSLVSKGQFQQDYMNAAFYALQSYYYYGKLESIVTEAVDAGVKTIAIAGKVATETDITITSDITNFNLGNGTLYIGVDSEPIVYLETGVKVSGGNTINVAGALYAERAKDVSTGDDKIISQVRTTDSLIPGDKLWTSVAYAMLHSEPGAIIALTNDWEITKDTIIPEGITIDSETNEKNVIVNDATLTIQGVLVADPTLKDGNSDGESGAVEIDGELVSTTDFTSRTAFGDAVYYETVDTYKGESLENTYYVLTAVSNLPYVAPLGYDVTVYATKIGSMTVVGDGDNTISFNGAVESADLVIDEVILVIPAGQEVTISVSNVTGQISFANTNSGTKGMTFTESDGVLTLAGTTIDSTDASAASASIRTSGIMSVDGYTLDEDIVINGTLVSEGTVKLLGNVTVKGALVADNASKLTLGADGKTIIVTGDLIATAATEDESAGRVTVVPTKIIIGDADQEISAGATVSGKVTATQYWVYKGATIDEDLVKDLKTATFKVGSSVWLTVYGSGNIDFGTAAHYNIVPNMPSASFAYWYDQDDEDEEAVTGSQPIANSVYIADVEYNVYEVHVKSDDGVKSISLNGMVMVHGTADGDNVYILENLPAGTYKVTYTLKSGYTGTPQLYTEAGTIMKDYTISISGDYSDDIVYQLSGTEKEVTPEPEPTPTPEKESEWTITTILLVILVVLIAIMAVIVALKLNRN